MDRADPTIVWLWFLFVRQFGQDGHPVNGNVCAPGQRQIENNQNSSLVKSKFYLPISIFNFNSHIF